MVSTLGAVGLGLMVAALLVAAAESWADAGSASATRDGGDDSADDARTITTDGGEP